MSTLPPDLPALAARVDAASAHARQLLALTLAQLTPPLQTAGTPAQQLEALPVAQWFELDQRLRGCVGHAFGGWPGDAGTAIAWDVLPASLQQPLLLLSCAHANGRVREQALRRLVHFPGRLALCAALVRSADWSRHVRVRAQATAAQLLAACSLAQVVASWPLVLRLQARGRLDAAWFDQQVLGWLVQPGQVALLQALLRSPDDRVRAWSHRYVLDAAPAWADTLAVTAIADRSAAVALHALRHALRRQPPAMHPEIARSALGSPRAAVRREGLRALVAAQGPGWTEAVHAGLLDRAGAVRSVAAFVLHDRLGASPLPVWRQALDAAADRPSLAALTALADRAEREDAARFLRWLPRADGRLHWHCVRGLVRCADLTDAPTVMALLAGGNRRALRVMRQAVVDARLVLDLPMLRALWAMGPLDTCRQATLAWLLIPLPHWRRLHLVLSLLPLDTLPRGLAAADPGGLAPRQRALRSIGCRPPAVAAGPDGAVPPVDRAGPGGSHRGRPAPALARPARPPKRQGD
ncbi:hypothetical protein [Stenotrophomonas sp.]|uniref:hypothetical protein n=1 Tax=Stenotrophomonas sp. TaxID=69392 RepID=UPI002FC63C7C